MLRRAFLLLPAVLRAAAPAVDLARTERNRVLRLARAYLAGQPVTITASASPRSAGGRQDYFSEGDYWWPDPRNPGGPYVRRDGLTNPDNFVAHRQALIRFSRIVPALAAAWQLTGQRRYADAAARHLRAWFLDPETRLNPHLRYAQAIHGQVSGRGTGLIDTLHLVEVARAVAALEKAPAPAPVERQGIRAWFAEYLDWMTTHPYGLEERDAQNNHGTCWALQAAEFARLTGNEKLRDFCRERYKKVLLPVQMAPDGSFPLELQRTKPYGYSLFNLDVMASLCQSLSTPRDDLWQFRLPDGRQCGKAVEFLAPYIADKSKWPFARDVMYWDVWPVRHPGLLFAGLAYGRPEWLDLWSRLDPDPKVEEIVRNFPIRQPLLWTAAR